MLKDFFKLAIENLTHRKLRSWLTVIGIVIGIAAVVALVSLGRGLQYTVDQQFSKIGADKITITPKSSVQGVGVDNTGLTLTIDDLDVVRKSAGVEEAIGPLQRTAKVEFNKKIKYTLVRGLPVDDSRMVYDSSGLYDVEYGRTLRQGDTNKVIIGPEIAKESFFGREIAVGDKIKINDRSFTVVGIIKKGGNPGISRAIIMTIDDARNLFNNEKEVSMIMVKIYRAEELDAVVDVIKKDLRKHRNLKEGKEDFNVESTKKFVESFLRIFNVISTLLIGLASISLIVGGIGIANTMYTAVLERNREIGIMKSVGAKNSNIIIIFLIESALIGLVGGIIGALLGSGISLLAERLIEQFLGEGFFKVFLPWWLLLGSIVFAMIIGTISGILPAKQAAELNPVDALRK
ncbi:MAG: ABC transporter permease [Candidatus Woesearchaeota archaeon]|nr:MAG: ABC transporter permease [Candidatus Woesearchaeota archaeon]